MNEFEINVARLQNFYEEIERLKSSDGTMHALKDVKELNEKCLEFWEKFKKVLNDGDRIKTHDLAFSLAEEIFLFGKKSKNLNIKEFIFWLQNNLTVIAGNSELSDEIYEKEMNSLRNKLSLK